MTKAIHNKRQSPSGGLTFDQVQQAVVAAKDRFALIRKKYTDIKAYLVFSLPGGQVGIDASPREILNEFPAMVVDDHIKADVLGILVQLEKSELTGRTTPSAEQEIRRLEQQFDQLTPRLQYDEQCQIELRFKVLNYELIWRLQSDELIDLELTPQTKASIRIVLGTLAQFR